MVIAREPSAGARALPTERSGGEGRTGLGSKPRCESVLFSLPSRSRRRRCRRSPSRSAPRLGRRSPKRASRRRSRPRRPLPIPRGWPSARWDRASRAAAWRPSPAATGTPTSTTSAAPAAACSSPTNGGLSFQPAWKGPTYGAVGALAVAPSDPKTVWAGTGEANPRNDVSWGDGVYVTHDGAKTWTHAGLADTSQIARILVDPRHPERALVAALGDPWKDSPARGVYRTDDGGRHWAKTLYAGPASGAADLAWNPRHPSTVFAAIWHFRREPWYATSGGTDDGLYRSRDGGRTWAKIAGHGFPGGLLGRIGIAVAPGDARRVYAVVQSKQGTIWRSDDAGDTWVRTSESTLPEQRPFYFSHLAVDPADRDRVISLSMYITVSKDGGRSWKHLTGVVHAGPPRASGGRATASASSRATTAAWC